MEVGRAAGVKIAVEAGKAAGDIDAAGMIDDEGLGGVIGAFAAPGADPLEISGGIKFGEEDVDGDAGVMGGMVGPGAGAGRVEVDFLTGVHAGDVDTAETVNSDGGAVVIAFSAPGTGPEECAAGIEFAEKGVEIGHGAGVVGVQIGVGGFPGVEIGDGAGKIALDIDMVGGIDGEAVTFGAAVPGAPGADPMEDAIGIKLAEKDVVGMAGVGGMGFG